jgi:hypothetical protein
MLMLHHRLQKAGQAQPKSSSAAFVAQIQSRVVPLTNLPDWPEFPFPCLPSLAPKICH